MTTATEPLNKSIQEQLSSPSRRTQPESPKPADTEGAPTESDEPKFYASLAELVANEDTDASGKRVYRVGMSDGDGVKQLDGYVLTNSKGNAALAAVDSVEVVKTKDVLEATRAALKLAQAANGAK